MWLVLIASALCLIFIPLLERLAPSIGLVDRPTADRKHHIGEVPIVGGIAIFLSICAASVISAQSLLSPTLLTLCFFMLLLGTVDDIITLSARFRLLVQIALATAMVLLADIRIHSIGDITGGGVVELSSSVSIVFTIVCAVGVINAINMIDGLDGLSGSVLLVSFFALAVLAIDYSLVFTTQLFSIAGCLCAFLVYNNRIFRPKAKIFLGDAGSMMLGLVLVWYFIELTQSRTPAFGTISAGWIFGLPLVDTVSVMLSRIIDKRSPFDAGRDHMHHRLRRAGFSVNGTVCIMLAMHVALVSIGVYFGGSPEMDTMLFWGFVVFTVLHFVVSRFFLEIWGRKVLGTLSKSKTRDSEQSHP